MADNKRVDLSGRDWFTVDEAAHYCGVSNSQFRKNALSYGLIPRQFMGKQLYERAQLYRAIYESPTWDSAAASTNSPATMDAAAALRQYEKLWAKRARRSK